MTWTIATAGQALRTARLTCRDLLEQCLQRIDQDEAQLQAWVLVDRKRAQTEADSRDRELRQGFDRGPLHGIPIGIKDIFDVFDWPTACGSKLWQQAIARQDAPTVRRLREAGAVLIGKTVTTQYASFDPPPTRNPWNPARTPGGSSSGSAAAVAARMCLASLGSQTGGSITRPASYCGVTACKPTYGLASLEGILPLAPSMDHPGPMATCVYDVALVMQAMADPGRGDWVAALMCEPTPVPVLGRLRGLFERLADDEVRVMMDEVCLRLERAGASIQEVALPSSFEEVLLHHRVLMAVEAATYHRERLTRHPEDYRPHIRRLIEEGLACSAPEYARAKEHQGRLKREMEALFHGINALLAPATTSAAPDASSTGNPAFNSPWSYTGLPVVSLPVMLSRDRLPLGVQLIGPAFAEGNLFLTARWTEKALTPDLGEPPLSRGG